jgi:hypothetical protein
MIIEKDITIKRRIWRVEALRPCRVADVDCEPFTAAPGEVFEVQEPTAGALLESGQVAVTDKPVTR